MQDVDSKLQGNKEETRLNFKNPKNTNRKV